jgi:hypothetical protein
MVNFFRLVGGTTVQGIDNTTKNIINNLLSNILGQNLSRRDQAKLFQETLNDPEYNRARSLVIARTESTKTANFGINMGAESSDYEVQKFWINTKDKRTRRSHLLMTKDRIALNQPFIVGGIEMMYPGEVGAPAAEVVNCRCVMATEALKDEDGLPILKPRTPPYIRAGSATRLPILPKPIIEVQQPTNIDQAKLKALEIINRNTNIRISNIEVDKNLTLKDFNEKINQLDKLTQDYNIVTGFTNKENVKLIFKSNKYLYGFIETDKGGKDLTRINFGSHAGNNRINFNAEGINRREFSKIDDDKLNISTTTHEFGHLISISEQGFLNSKHNQFWNEIININKRYVTEVKQYGTSASYDKNKLNSIYLGRYAESNLNEFMAEAFTEYKLSSNASQYALEVGRLIDKYFKK